MAKIKILYISNTADIAGAEICLLTLVKHLNLEFFEPVVVLPKKGPLLNEMQLLAVKTYISPLEWWIRVPSDYGLIASGIKRRVSALVNIIASEQPAVVHTNTSVIWEGALAAAFSGVPHIWHLHEKLDEHPSLKPVLPLSAVYNLISLLSDKVIAVSKAVKSQINDPACTSKMSIIYNGVEEFDPSLKLKSDKDSLRKQLGASNNSIIAISVGSIIKEKGHDVLLEAAVLAKEKLPNMLFVIVGRGNKEAVTMLSNKINSLGLKDIVYYLGYRRDVPSILSQADLLVLASHSEAFPLVVLEAMAAGKPVVATDCGGPREMVVDGETGFIVPVNSAKGLCDKIVQLGADMKMLQLMGKKGRMRFDSLFTAKVYADNFEKIYFEISAKNEVKKLSLSELKVVQTCIKTYQYLSEKILFVGLFKRILHFLKEILPAQKY